MATKLSFPEAALSQTVMQIAPSALMQHGRICRCQAQF